MRGSRRKLFDIDLITHCYSAVSENRLTLVPILFSFSVESAMATSSQSLNVPVGAPVSVGPLSALFEEVGTEVMTNPNQTISISGAAEIQSTTQRHIHFDEVVEGQVIQEQEVATTRDPSGQPVPASPQPTDDSRQAVTLCVC